MGGGIITSDFTTSHTKDVGADYNYIYKYGKVVQLAFRITTTSNVSAWGVLGTIPEGFRPKSYYYIRNVNNLNVDIYISSGGNISISGAKNSGTAIAFNACYITD